MAAFGSDVLAGVAHELTLFAAVAFLLGGASDTALDLIWMGRSLWRRVFVFRLHARADATTLAVPKNPGRIAIFIPAWDESTVIADMLRHTVKAVAGTDCVIYVGAYPNDQATIDAVRGVCSPRIRLVVGLRTGPTTKADCLNTIWQRMLADEATGIMYHLHQAPSTFVTRCDA